MEQGLHNYELVEFIESAEKADEVLPKLADMVGSGFFEIKDTSIVTPKAVKRTHVAEPPAIKREGNAKMMRILIGEHDKWNGKPLHEALVESLRANDIAGATVYRGIEGYGASTLIHRPHPFRFSASDSPIQVQVIDTAEKIQKLIPVLDTMVSEGLIVMSEVEVIKYTHQDSKDAK